MTAQGGHDDDEMALGYERCMSVEHGFGRYDVFGMGVGNFGSCDGFFFHFHDGMARRFRNSAREVDRESWATVD